mgnify:CR=1 FL=1
MIKNQQFKDDVDYWIKTIQSKLSDLEQIPAVVNENLINIQHNYELIYELKDQIDDLKAEINAIKLIQIISLKQKQTGSDGNGRLDKSRMGRLDRQDKIFNKSNR